MGYYGNNEHIKKCLENSDGIANGEKINYINISEMDKDDISATSFNGFVFDTSLHGDENSNELIDNIISSNPDIDVMSIISDIQSEDGANQPEKIEKEVSLLRKKHDISTIPYLVNSEREANIFMNTVFSTLSSKTIRSIEQIEEYKIGVKENMLNALKKVIITLELKDPYTRDHSLRVSNYAKQIAIKMGLSDEEVKAVEQAGWLHDIGKLAINDAVLMKPGRLDDKEFIHMRSHAAIGGVLLNSIFDEGEFTVVKDYSKHHHERYDGRGYPDNMEGENIPLGAIILCLADSFDAMTTQRSYNKQKKIEDTLLNLQTNSGIQFDPKVAETFIELLKQEPEKLKETLGITINRSRTRS